MIVYLGRGPDGKRRYHDHTVLGTKRDADKYLARVLADLEPGAVVTRDRRRTLNAFLDDWLAAAGTQVRPRTLDGYRRVLDAYVRKPLGAIPLQSLKAGDVQRLVRGMVDRGLSPATVRRAVGALSTALSVAVEWHEVTTNVAQGVRLPRMRRAEVRVLTADESAAVVRAAGESQHGLLFAFALATGMRPEEYLALRWQDVDLAARRVQVVRALVRIPKQGWSFEEVKTARSRRNVPLPAEIARQLVVHRKAQLADRLAMGPAWEDNDLVFCGQRGQPLDEHNLYQRHFKAALRGAGLCEEDVARIRLYDLRHTCATLMLAAGVAPKVVSERLGHSSVAFTMDTYAHVTPAMAEDAAELLGSLLFKGTPEGGR